MVCPGRPSHPLGSFRYGYAFLFFGYVANGVRDYKAWLDWVKRCVDSGYKLQDQNKKGWMLKRLLKIIHTVQKTGAPYEGRHPMAVFWAPSGIFWTDAEGYSFCSVQIEEV